ncbi:MAG: hypothetical protein JWN34_2625 [Bryobacterales bacterium]|nr:hypothetical protein [Bryobacterales bacterium]
MHRKLRATLSVLLTAFFCLETALPATGPGDFSDTDNSRSELRPLIERFSLDRGNILRYYTVTTGSLERRDRLKRFYETGQAALAAKNFDTLSQEGKIDYILFRNSLDHDFRMLQREAAEQSETAPYLPFSGSIATLERSRRKMDPVDGPAAARALDSLTNEIDVARKAVETRLRAETPEAVRSRRVIGNRAVMEANGLRNNLRAWFTFYDGYDPMFTWWAAEAYRGAESALNGYVTFLSDRVAGATAAKVSSTDDIVGNPIGRAGLMSELAYEMIPYTPEQLIAIANKEYAWCEKEMMRASREMGFGDDWKKAVEKIKTMYVEPGKQPALIRDLAREAENFVAEFDLVTVPPVARETWRMEMMAPDRQLVTPFFTGGEVISVSYPVNSMTYEQKMTTMRGNNIPMSRATVFHELIPGHHLQLYYSPRFKPYRSNISGTPFLTEGWSLYWELLLWDMKFQKTPEDRVGALVWHMHRCARIIFSLSFHLGKMSPAEAVDFLVDRVGFERENAAGEVRRSFGGAYSPLYQAAYLVGGLQLKALHDQLVGPGKMTNRDFNDAVLRENRIPIELIRASLTNQQLTKDYAASWKFQGEVIPVD